MLLRLSLLAFTLASALEEVPHASGLKSTKKAAPAATKPSQLNNIKRAHIVPAQGLSLLPHAHRMSTGVRRAPKGAAVAQVKSAAPPAVRLVRPGVAPTVPYVMVPVPLLQLPQIPLLHMTPPPAGGKAVELPTLPPFTLPTLPPLQLPQFGQQPNFPTLAPAPGGPITLAPMPTMPGLTMPPSFQRLLGMTSTAAPERNEPREEYSRQVKEYTDERATKKKKGLSSVASRLPKFVDNDENLISPEKNAEWIVPF